jgi:hypothetical protein
MRKVNWNIVEKQSKDIKKKIKNIQAASDYFSDKPDPGYFKDNISKNMISIKAAKSSSLRRYVKVIDKYYDLITSPTERKFLLDKKVEIEAELNTRQDGTIKKDQ